MLTRKQKDLLLFIHERMARGDVAPSFDEMKEALGLKSKSGIHRLINALVERGYLERLPHRARALEVKRLPEGYDPQQADRSIVAGRLRAAKDLLDNVADQVVRTIPLYGKIAAGTPIEAIRDEGETISMPSDMLGGGNHYALRVEGDSMIEAGIYDQDIVVIRQTEQAQDGQIVVALVDDAEATLKTLRREQNQIALIPANPSYEIRTLPADRVKIQGTLASLIRHY